MADRRPFMSDNCGFTCFDGSADWTTSLFPVQYLCFSLFQTIFEFMEKTTISRCGMEITCSLFSFWSRSQYLEALFSHLLVSPGAAETEMKNYCRNTLIVLFGACDKLFDGYYRPLVGEEWMPTYNNIDILNIFPFEWKFLRGRYISIAYES